MNLISVYVAVGAISFVKCEVSYNAATPFQNWHRNQIYAGEWNVKGKHFRDKNVGTEVGEEMYEERRPEVEESNETEKDFFQGFNQIKNIYIECKTKVNKRLKSIMKANVRSRLPELKRYILSLYECVKVLSLRSLDEVLQEDVIPFTDYACFVKDGVNVTEGFPRGRTAAGEHLVPLKDYATRVLAKGWIALLHSRLEKLLQTHSLKFQFDKTLISEGRRRRRDHRMFAMMVMGFMIMASILVPMKFQFLAVLGGKSLILAKMALIISAISGLKKIATSNVGYGFYHTGNDNPHHDHLHHGFHEKHYHANPQGYN